VRGFAIGDERKQQDGHGLHQSRGGHSTQGREGQRSFQDRPPRHGQEAQGRCNGTRGPIQGQGADAFKAFKANVDDYADRLDDHLGRINSAHGGMGKALNAGDTGMADNANQHKRSGATFTANRA